MQQFSGGFRIVPIAETFTHKKQHFVVDRKPRLNHMLKGSIEARVYRREMSLEMEREEIAEAQKAARRYISSGKLALIGGSTTSSSAWLMM